MRCAPAKLLLALSPSRRMSSSLCGPPPPLPFPPYQGGLSPGPINPFEWTLPGMPSSGPSRCTFTLCTRALTHPHPHQCTPSSLHNQRAPGPGEGGKRPWQGRRRGWQWAALLCCALLRCRRWRWWLRCSSASTQAHGPHCCCLLLLCGPCRLSHPSRGGRQWGPHAHRGDPAAPPTQAQAHGKAPGKAPLSLPP